MRVLFTVVVLFVVLCLALPASADGTFSSRRTSESDVSKYRRDGYSVYARRLSLPSASASAGQRVFGGLATHALNVGAGDGALSALEGFSYVARVGSREETGNRFGTDTADEKCVFWSGYGWHGHDWWRRHGHPTHSTFSFGYYGTPHYSHYSYWPPSCHHWHGRPTGHLFRPTRPFGFRPHHGSHAGSGVYLYFSW